MSSETCVGSILVCPRCGTEHRKPVAPVEALNDARAERDRLQRLFNRLEAAITHHKRGCEANDVPDTHDEALWAARDRVLKDVCAGKG